MNKALWGVLAALFFLSVHTTPAAAQATVIATCGSVTVPLGTGHPLTEDTTGTLCATGGGGGGGGAVTAVAGSYATGYSPDFGTLISPNAASLLGLTTAIKALITTTNTLLGQAIPAGTNQIGHVITDTASVTAASGNVADNAADSGDPLKIGCVYLTTLTTYTTTGNRANCNADQFGNLRTVSGIFKISGTDAISNFNFGAFPIASSVNSTTQAQPGVMMLNFDGTNWDRVRSMQGVDGTGLGVDATESAGTKFSNITTTATTTVKSGAGTLHNVCINTPTALATIVIYNNTAGSGTKIASVTNPASVAGIFPVCAKYDVYFSTGLTVVTGVAAQDITVTYY